MPNMLITLSDEDSAALKELAENHGHKVKPFVEYLVRVQIGALPEPSVKRVPLQGSTTGQPTKVQPDAATAESTPNRIPEKATAPETHEQDHRPEVLPEQPAKGNALRDARPPETGAISRNASEYTSRTEFPNVSTNGTHFLVSLLGQRSFHATIEEAKKARAEIRPFST